MSGLSGVGLLAMMRLWVVLRFCGSGSGESQTNTSQRVDGSSHRAIGSGGGLEDFGDWGDWGDSGEGETWGAGGEGEWATRRVGEPAAPGRGWLADRERRGARSPQRRLARLGREPPEPQRPSPCGGRVTWERAAPLSRDTRQARRRRAQLACSNPEAPGSQRQLARGTWEGRGRRRQFARVPSDAGSRNGQSSCAEPAPST